MYVNPYAKQALSQSVGYSINPDGFSSMIDKQVPDGVIIDEVQKIPKLGLVFLGGDVSAEVRAPGGRRLQPLCMKL